MGQSYQQKVILESMIIHSMNQINALERLKNERKLLKSDMPPNFFARPVPKKEGNKVLKDDLNYFVWICGIPGKPQTLWENSKLLMYMFFNEQYPQKPPKCQFDPPLPHPNIYPSGSVCLSLINEAQGWKPNITIKEILQGIQLLLNEPNEHSPAQQEAYNTYTKDRAKYDQDIVNFCKKHQAANFDSYIKQLVHSGNYRTSIRPPPSQTTTKHVIDI